MPVKRKTRNLPHMNTREAHNQMSFFDPVYQSNAEPINDEESDNETSNNGFQRRQTSRDTHNDESNETLDALPMAHASMGNGPDEEDGRAEISTAKIIERVKQIQGSIEQAQTMLDSMEQFKNIVPGSDEQCEKLRVIIANLAEQQAGYVNLLNLITLTNEERSVILNRMSAVQRQESTNTHDQSNENDDEDDGDVEEEEEEEEEEDEEEEENERNVRSPRRLTQSPVRPRIESKIGFTPQATTPGTPTIPAAMHSWDIEPNNRHDNSNYDSLVGSLKSDTINWKDQQSTSGDEASDVESDKEMERNLMLQKEQLRALQGQKRALLALKKRSEQRLIEQQQLLKKQAVEEKESLSENDLLSGINHLRDRLKLLRNLYEEKHQSELQQIQSPAKKSVLPTDQRVKSLQHVRERLDELEEIVTYYQDDLMNQQEEETTVYEETPISPDDVPHLKSLMIQQKQQRATNEHTPQQLDQLSNELAAKRLELEQAKTALSRLQQMVETIEPDQRSPAVTFSSSKPTKNSNDSEANTKQQKQQQSSSSQPTTNSLSKAKTSLLSSILSPKPSEPQKPSDVATNGYADAKMAAQHREIERLVESRQRLHTIKDQIASLHQSMTTPTLPPPKDASNNTSSSQRMAGQAAKSKSTAYQEQLNDSRNHRTSYGLSRSAQNERDEEDEDSEMYRFECESGDGEEIDDDIDQEIPARIKQGNFHAPEDIVAEHEQRLLNKSAPTNNELSVQMKEICSCLSSFVQEQKSFNRHIEEHLTASKPTASPTVDPVFNQFQQQVLTQGLIVNLNSAYREIAILQTEVSALQTENHRLTSSLSSVERSQFYSREDSKESLYSLDQSKPTRPQPRSRLDEHVKPYHPRPSGNAASKFENSSKTSFNSQSTGQQTAIHVTQTNMETTPNKHERNATFTSGNVSSPKSSQSRSKTLSNSYEITSNHHRRRSSKENLSKSFIIRRRPLTTDHESNLIQSQVFKYNQPSSLDRYPQYRQDTYDVDDENDDDDDDDDDDDGTSTSDKERQIKDLSATISNIRPSAYYSSANQDLDNIDIQTLDLQVKSIMVQLFPFMRLHIDDVFNQSVLNHIRERILFLFKQQPDSAALVRHFHNQFSESLGKTIEKYCGTTIRECAGDLIQDITAVASAELAKYKLMESTRRSQTIRSEGRLNEEPSKQRDEFPSLYDTSVPHYAQQTSSVDDGENETKYHIELAESESRPLMLVGSDEEDNDSDQEENKDSDLETAVSRQEINLPPNESTVSTELHSNGHEYVLVNPSTSADPVQDVPSEEQAKENESPTGEEGLVQQEQNDE